MSRPVLTKLLREWAALLAVFALVLGPLALTVSRSLGTAEKVAIASGAKPFALCMPGGGSTDPTKPLAKPACDHCTAACSSLLPPIPPTTALRLAEVVTFVPEAHRDLRAFPRAPPARGPPAA